MGVSDLLGCSVMSLFVILPDCLPACLLVFVSAGCAFCICQSVGRRSIITHSLWVMIAPVLYIVGLFAFWLVVCRFVVSCLSVSCGLVVLRVLCDVLCVFVSVCVCVFVCVYCCSRLWSCARYACLRES